MKQKCLVTGSCGLVGSEAVRFFADRGFQVIGVDNDMRSFFFGPEASTATNKALLQSSVKDYIHWDFDIRNEIAIRNLFKMYKFDVIIHAAAQPSHDWAAKDPYTDFSINTTATLYLLENFYEYCPNATFIYVSTNKVYGDIPNLFRYKELPTRYEIYALDYDLEDNDDLNKGFNEKLQIDQCTHSLFGCSKLAADLLVQEYGRYFGLKTGIFRAGCITGPAHSGAELHGFLSYLAKCVVTGKEYTVYGHKGKQVRDNIHAYDLVNMFWSFSKQPHSGEVYNVGGSRHSNISILEAIDKLERLTGKKLNWKYSKVNRIGDHKWYISDISKFRSHYPEWDYKYNMDMILKELIKGGRNEVD